MVFFFRTEYEANDDFSGPPQHAGSTNAIFNLCQFRARIPSWAWGVGFWGDLSIELVLGALV